MKPAPFDYAVAGDLVEVTRNLAQAAGAAKPVAGNQSLGPMMNLRLARPSLLIDVTGLASLRAVTEATDHVRLGAAITHAEIEDGEVTDPTGGWLQTASGGIAYRAVRNRGTLGGSLAHADPAADWLSAFLALDALLHLEGPEGRRSTPLAEALLGAFTLALGESEILTAVEVPRLGPAARWGYHKINRKTGEFADAIGIALLDPDRDFCRVVCGALDGPPLPLPEVAEALGRDGRQAARALAAPTLAAALPELDEIDRQLHLVAVQRAIDQVQAS